MNKVSTIIFGLLSIVSLVVGIGAYNKQATNTTINTTEKSVVGPDTYFGYTANNDLQKFGQTRPLTVATTTVCAIQSPVSTSTLSFGSVKFVVGSTTNATVTLAKATTAFATTTILTQAALTGNAQGVFMATSSPLLATGLINDLVFAPNTWFVVGMADATPEAGAGTFSPSGSCSAQFIRN